ncbi:response regulator transcription factor [Paenibacillus mucilaginosus]|uniref:AraC family transcriptional regulator n=3 Tax=Paenibacillus mucilaginosus TaxID=61624 RepID=H6NI01_9BACL|nr:response regulator transcription factor [Paenibacillus mucilaginosus]AEI43094.1 two component transcriptional regulator, AraC family [Paenibacillus mucilaginosus KNP414]AFC30772.1 AraC family transcriptional regulator [Paenibacillus mucilaginosus 3016]AFH63095.1 AraC family transcriptional regulator [Paenibacillus mucilaginosus K02]WDM24711.1 response regulator transcription factor [Paenibacillus mucilaginosus]WFA19379.1 response regulator transcription factor [Paenibacillus mucilaginosus]
MYKVLLVDDEFIILDGISSVVDWGAVGTELSGTAENGVEALEFVRRNPPDIIITDIRMPGMDGLELVAAVSKEYPQISFVLLSGFSEFDYAQTAMQYGVKHYLLKPCSEEKLVEALTELVAEIRERDDREGFVRSIKLSLERVMPHAKEQFLKEFVTNKTYGAREWDYFKEVYGLPFQSQTVRLLLIELEGEHEYEHLFAVKNIAEDIFPNPLLSSTAGGHVLLLMEDTLPQEELFERIDMVRSTFMRYYRTDLTAALSEPGQLTQARRLYKQTIECLNHRFYLEEGSLITERDISIQGDADHHGFTYDEERLIMPIKAGAWQDAERELLLVFRQLGELRLDIAATKSYVIQLFMAMIRLCDPERMSGYLTQLTGILDSTKLQSMHHLVMSVAEEITRERYERNRNKQSQIVMTVKKIVERHLHDETLSLQMVAKEIFMNPDYVGKMFKKETGEKFTNFVLRSRIELALEKIRRSSEQLTISELAEKTGFGDNTPYFSKIFKRYTGYSPSEYRKAP